jgi:hypothetical protein
MLEIRVSAHRLHITADALCRGVAGLILEIAFIDIAVNGDERPDEFGGKNELSSFVHQ